MYLLNCFKSLLYDCNVLFDNFFSFSKNSKKSFNCFSIFPYPYIKIFYLHKFCICYIKQLAKSKYIFQKYFTKFFKIFVDIKISIIADTHNKPNIIPENIVCRNTSIFMLSLFLSFTIDLYNLNPANTYSY